MESVQRQFTVADTSRKPGTVFTLYSRFYSRLYKVLTVRTQQDVLADCLGICS